MQPIKITAHLYNGFTSSDPWSPSIDGILAYWVMRERLGDDFHSPTNPMEMQPVEGLPLQRIEHGDWWWYAASSPIYQTHASARKYAHRRFDDAHEARLDLQGKSGKVLTAAGPYKNARIPLLLRVTDSVEWHVIGDQAEIERLLGRCGNIGAKFGSGYGRVKRWSFSPGDAEIAMRQRPVPADYAAAQGIVGEEMRWGLRPPARLPINTTMCVMPEVA
ncbi:hypothetical protein G5B41_17495 [bacterium SGD-2]|nr:hypothetical protein [bacterium SGD-2]